MKELNLLTATEVSQHNTPDDCWIVIAGQIWDLTDFAPQHPGGSQIIFKFAGQDATQIYNEIHPPPLIQKTLTISKLKGTLRPSSHNTLPAPSAQAPAQNSGAKNGFPPLASILSAQDFEKAAKAKLTPKAYAYYSSAATDLVSVNANTSFWSRIWFRPRLLRNVTHVDTTCKIQGVTSSVPFLVAPAAMAKLAHPQGELAIARACKRNGVIQCASINASYPVEDIISEAPDHPFFFQLYVNKNKESSELLLKRVWDLGVRVLFLTVDAPVPGKREADERVKAETSISTPMSGTSSSSDEKGSGLTRTLATYIDSGLSWDDLIWARKAWAGKLVLKGLQSVEDVKLAAEHRVDGVVLSNHGGRNLDTSPPSLLVLLELRKHFPVAFSKMEIYIDGGITRGTDVLKAYCLGATAVLLGRPFLYSLAYGEEGVERLIDILRDEVETGMRLLGVTSLAQLRPGLINTQDIDHLLAHSLDEPNEVQYLKSKI
ncbi:Cytochrome b2, mitochondrial [Lachnellula hyalina]|uniref:L-lactate dehydrogenase (cytochrome) n=1 Tax=Lachnellula hyalina TaxID=1316788 RepID=A0A8H8R4A8_9HELO|nr:Cytochrome b2, mitochondrial [Lachnellula hyalina]TVY28273.1 Cytochrome b2, mitochondrial [Lachnellula hyalina]